MRWRLWRRARRLLLLMLHLTGLHAFLLLCNRAGAYGEDNGGAEVAYGGQETLMRATLQLFVTDCNGSRWRSRRGFVQNNS